MVLNVRILEKLANSKANRKRSSICTKLRKEKPVSENVAPSGDSKTEHGKATITNKLAEGLVNENVLCQRPPGRILSF